MNAFGSDVDAILVARVMADRGFITRDLNICLIVSSSILYLLRCYSRVCLYRNVGLDDAIIGVALVLAITLSVFEIKEVQNGAGRQMVDVSPDDLRSFFFLLPTMQLLYLAGTGVVRLGIVAFLPRLTTGLAREKPFKMAMFVLASAIGALTIGAVFGLLFECSPVRDLWHKGAPGAKCYSAEREATLMYTHSALSIFFDIALFVLPLWIIRSSAIKLQFRIIMIFSVALIAVAAGLARLVVIVRIDLTENTTYELVFASVWTDIEIHVGIWVSCFPALKPLVRMCTSRLGIKSSVSHTGMVSKPLDGHAGGKRSKRENNSWIPLEELPRVQSRIEGASNTMDSDDKWRGIMVKTRVEISTHDHA